jgi:hypothetical protein
MKQKLFYTVLGAASILMLAFMVTNVGAQSSGQGTNPLQTLTPMPGMQSTPVAPGWGMGMHGGMMSGSGMKHGGMMGGSGMMHGGMMNGSGMMSGTGTNSTYSGTTMNNGSGMYMGGGYGMYNGSMMGGDPMHEAAQLLGMTDQDIYSQMMTGKSVVQIAAEKGVTEQQLMDAMMTTRRTMYNQAVQQGQMTRVYADTMLTMMNNNIRTMINMPGYGAGTGNMMTQTPQNNHNP